jgi:hypothetical protein
MVLESTIRNFLCKLEMGRTFFEDAAKLLVKMLDEDPQVFDEILKLHRVSWLNRDVLETFEALGRGQIALETIFLPRHVLQRLMQLPVEEQSKLATRPVAVYQGRRNGEVSVARKRLCELNRREARTVLGPNGARTVAEQVALVPAAKSGSSLGCFELTVLNGKPFLKKVAATPNAQRITLSDHRALLEVFE